MAIVNTPQFFFPRGIEFQDGAVLFSIASSGLFQIDAANEFVFAAFQVPKAGNIEEIGFRLGAIATGATIDVGLYTVDTAQTTVRPGTLWSANANGALVVAGTDDNKWVWVTLTAAAAVVKGDFIGIKITNPAVSPGDISMSAIVARPKLWPASVENTTETSVTFIGAIKYDDSSVEVPWGLYSGGDAAGTLAPVVPLAISTATTPDVIGTRFQVPVSMRVNAVAFAVELDGNCDIYLVAEDWDGTGGDALATVALDIAYRAVSGPGIGMYLLTTEVTLDADTWYRMVIVPNSVTALNVYSVIQPDAETFAGIGGTNFHFTTAKDPNDDGDFTNFDNGVDGYRLAGMWIGFNGIEAGGGGGQRSYVG